MFVRPGGIITLGPIIQHVGMLPGGPLEVQVYTGADGTVLFLLCVAEPIAINRTLMDVIVTVWCSSLL